MRSKQKANAMGGLLVERGESFSGDRIDQDPGASFSRR